MIEFLPRPRIFLDEVRNEADIEAMVQIHAAGFRRGWSIDEIEKLLGEDTVFAILLRRESILGVRRVLGFVLVRTVAGQAEILTIAVDPGRRGRGYGRQLLEEAMRRLYRDRVPEIFLEVDESNPAALALYRRLGFQEVGRRKGYYADGKGGHSAALVMRLQLR